MKKPCRKVQRLARLKLKHEGFRPPLAHVHRRVNVVSAGCDGVLAMQRMFGFETTPSSMWTYWKSREQHVYLRITHGREVDSAEAIRVVTCTCTSPTSAFRWNQRCTTNCHRFNAHILESCLSPVLQCSLASPCPMTSPCPPAVQEAP